MIGQTNGYMNTGDNITPPGTANNLLLCNYKKLSYDGYLSQTDGQHGNSATNSSRAKNHVMSAEHDAPAKTYNVK